MSSFDYQLSTITKYRAGTSTDPYLDITETKPVVNGQIQLNEIPVPLYKVRIPDMFEVPHTSKSDLKENEYRVDYTEGIISFHMIAENTQKTYTYKGRGNHFVSYHRIWTKEQNGEVLETLGEIIDAGSEAIEQVKELAELIQETEESLELVNDATVNANTSADYAKTQGDYAKAQGDYAKTQADTASGVITSANGKIVEMDDTIVAANNKIAETETARQDAITATGNANTSADYAKTQGDYAKTQGEFANTQGNYAKDQGDYATQRGDDLVLRGEYSPTVSYKTNNMVTYNSKLYMAIKDSTGIEPGEVDTEYWRIIVQTAVSTEWDNILNKPSLVDTSREIITGAGLTGGGDLSADRTLTVDFEENNGVSTQASRSDHTHQSLTQLIDDLSNEKRSTVTLQPGMQIIQADQESAFSLTGLTGRTLVNLLGRDGNCEDASRWLLFQGSATTDATNKTQGSSGIKLTVTSGSFATATAVNTINAKANKFYIAVVDAKNGNATNASFYANGLTATKGVNSTADTTKFAPLWRAYAPTADVVASVIVQTNSSATGQYAYFDAVRFYEITADEYTALDSMTPQQVAAKYPYVDSVQPVRNPYGIRYGENLIPPFYEWSNTVIGVAKNIMVRAYELYQDSKDEANYATSVVQIPVIPGKTYTLSGEITKNPNSAVDALFFYWLDINGNRLPGEDATTRKYRGTYIVPTNAMQIQLYCVMNVLNDNTAYKTQIIKNPMFNIGNTAKSFKPREDAMLAMQTDLFADPVTGANADEVFERDGQYFKLAKWRKVALDEALNWIYTGTTSGFKNVSASAVIAGYAPVQFIATKYNGTLLRNAPTSTNPDAIGIGATGNLFLSVKSEDSGWGDSYTPTADEIKAYFMGWRMYDGEAGGAPYNGTGTKYWHKLSDGISTPGAGTTSLPTTPAPNWTPYQLLYQLATPTVEPITSEGQLTLIEGDNQIEVGTGIVLRERAKPTTVGLNYLINHVDVPAGWLRYKTNRIMSVYKNNQLADVVKVSNSATGQGGAFAYITPALFDPSAAYSVTYLMLDKYPAAPFTGSYAENEKALLLDAVKSIQENTTRISVLESKKAEKDAPAWIAPTFLNGATQYAEYQKVGYMKDGFGFVHLRGLVATAPTNSRIFILPAKYRPAFQLIFRVAGAGETYEIRITADGSVFTTSTGNYISLEGVTFSAEQ
ncbi:hypothetical protein [Paenibacillus sp. QZ-Y1]|uniref:hypothetical protein n=1 Tax=Paenibacillus sp. QZ-Y1 TaxID=3414511 RepID=UPI003F794337